MLTMCKRVGRSRRNPILAVWPIGLLRNLCVLALSVPVLACAPAGGSGAADIRPYLRVAQPDLAFGLAALDHARTEFLRPAPAATAPAAPPSGGGGGAGSLGSAITRGGFQVDLGLADVRGQERVLGVQIDQPIGADWKLETRLSAGQMQLRRALAPGAVRVGRLVLMEPGELRVDTRFVEVETTAFRRLPDILPAVMSGRLDLGAGAGLRATDSDLQVTINGLVDARSTYRQTQPFATLQARYRWDRLPARAFVEGRVYGRKQAGLRAGLDIVLR